jgi:hypothetical protein
MPKLFHAENSNDKGTGKGKGKEKEAESTGEPLKPDQYICRFLDDSFLSSNIRNFDNKEAIYTAMIKWTKKNNLNITEMVDFDEFILLWK